ncbi:SKS1 [Candida pseudojiufengensis]|uniref:SKS1 n=1 Tax=Candida pseudojiufengensis TaxID=497109 RepID=UPI002224D085|nr:SKS1 [Candida pseudojiufengensis]KAI5966473.1 SKS1 [Candida pseudojiufengensis]
MTLDILPILDKSLISKPYITNEQQQQPYYNNTNAYQQPKQLHSPISTPSTPNTPQYKKQKLHSNPVRNNNSNGYMLDGFMFNDQYKFIKKIGAGTYGLIYLVENIYTKERFAAKMLLKQPPQRDNNNTNSSSPSSSSLTKSLIQQQFYNYFTNQIISNPQKLNLENIKNQTNSNCPYLTEISLHLKVHNHPNIITIHDVYQLNLNFAIVIMMDYFEQGDLFGNIIDKQIFQSHPNKQLLMKNAMLQLIDGVEHCNLNSVYHCDLKPENIMVKYNPNYKRSSNDSSIIDYNELHLVIIDFGLAMKSKTICCNSCRGSSFYMAPERTTNYNTNKIIKSLIDMSQYPTLKYNSQTNQQTNESNCKYLPTLAGDIWSLGILFINITCSRNPWPIASFNESSINHNSSNSNDVFTNYILYNDKKILSSILPISYQFNLLLNKIFKLNPNDRINLSSLYNEIINCDFFKDNNNNGDYFGYKKTLTQQHQQYNNNNNQLYTPPESTAFNSYSSEFEEDEEDDEEEDEEEDEDDMEDEDEDEEEEYYTDDEDFDQSTYTNEYYNHQPHHPQNKSSIPKQNEYDEFYFTNSI